MQDGVIRRYGKLGFMEAGVEDLIITKKCRDCGKDVALLLGETICSYCKQRPGYIEVIYGLDAGLRTDNSCVVITKP